MTEINMPPHYRAFFGGKDILRIFHNNVQVWPKVISPTDPPAEPAKNTVIPHFDITLTHGKVETFAPRVNMIKPDANNVPFTSGMPPYAYPDLWVTFRVAKITGKTGQVNIKFGILKMPDWDSDADASAQHHCMFQYEFNNVVEGQFYEMKSNSASGWDSGFTFPTGINIYSGGEVDGATDVALDHVTFKFTGW